MYHRLIDNDPSTIVCIFPRNYSTRSSVICPQVIDGRWRIARWSRNRGYNLAGDSFSNASLSNQPPTSRSWTTFRLRIPSYCATFACLCISELGSLFMNIDPSIHEHLEWSSAFQHTLLSLFLTRVSVTWSAFVTLVGHFPNLRDLYISERSLQVDDRPVPPLPRMLRGRLVVISGTVMEFPIDRFVGLKMEYEELVMRGRSVLPWIHSQSLSLSRTLPAGDGHHVPTGAGADPHLIYHLHKPSKVDFLPTSAELLGKSLLDAFRRYDLWACRSTPGVRIQAYPGIRVSGRLCGVG
ncbi:hypothetical protein BDM02DRAFT_1774778 [Thelephora ganbajun]|uniref:Uncharacterized protein n=1 Tax=Thelephora ganbajun TaxID=370292 RepID=A0ACB6YZT1_THEGA|nr:hypothetical protein BDM02DRAFT_1774778 [Thelephora ganbajun]